MIRISLALFTIATLVSFGWSQRREYGTLPPNSFGRLEQDPDYRPRGDVFVEGDLEMYVARPGQAGLGNKYVVWGHDIFGWQSGHTMQLVDRLAADTEYTVILPNLFRGEQWPPPPSFQWELSLQYDWYDKIVPFITREGAEMVGMVGNCWGSYLALHTSASEGNLVKAAFSTHPSHVYFLEFFPDESVEDIYAAVNVNGVSQYFGNTPEEGPEYRPGGQADQLLDVIWFENFEAPCNHGFFSRGNLSDPLVYQCTERAYGEMLQFFRNYLR